MRRFSYDMLVGQQAIMISQKHPSGISEYAQYCPFMIKGRNPQNEKNEISTYCKIRVTNLNFKQIFKFIW